MIQQMKLLVLESIERGHRDEISILRDLLTHDRQVMNAFVVEHGLHILARLIQRVLKGVNHQ